ncbi:MAG: ABC transporter substrate-binding protein [bacterium]
MKLSILRALMLPAAFWAAGCSLTLDFSGDCKTNEGCASLGEDYICEGGVCVGNPAPPVCPEPLANGCDDIFGPLENDEDSTTESRLAAYLANRGGYELIAVHTPRGGVAAVGKEIIEAATRVAVEDINRSRAFVDIEGNGRKLAALICDDGSGVVEAGIEAATHAASCGAKVIVATQDSEPTKQIYLQVARQANVPVISPGALSPVLPTARTNGGTQDNDELLWRVRVPGSTTAQATAAAIKRLDRHDNVVVLYRDSPAEDVNDEGPVLWDVFERELCNGSFCQQNTVTAYGYTNLSNLLIPEISAVLRDVGQFDLVVTLTADLEDILYGLTAVATVAVETDQLPEIIQVDGARSGQAPGVFLTSLVAQRIDDLTRQRGIEIICNMAGISSANEGDGFAVWLGKFGEAAQGYLGLDEPTDVADRLVAPTAAYFDAVTLAAYAMAAAALSSSDGQIDTPGIIGGLKRLSDAGRETKVPPFDWPAGIAALRTRGAGGQAPTMNYDGASGPVDLDQNTGDVRNQLTDLWQYRIANQGNDAADFSVRTITIVGNGMTIRHLSSGTTSAREIDVNLDLIDNLERSESVCPEDSYPKLVTPMEMSGQ